MTPPLVSFRSRRQSASLGYDPSFGARPLKRIIEKHLVNKLSEKMLAGEVAEGTIVEVRLDKQGLIKFVTRLKAEAVEQVD